MFLPRRFCNNNDIETHFTGWVAPAAAVPRRFDLVSEEERPGGRAAEEDWFWAVLAREDTMMVDRRPGVNRHPSCFRCCQGHRCPEEMISLWEEE